MTSRSIAALAAFLVCAAAGTPGFSSDESAGNNALFQLIDRSGAVSDSKMICK